MRFEIRNRWSGQVQFSCELTAEMGRRSYSFQLGFAAEQAIGMGADLGGANLGGADLRNADLGGADLRNADLRNAHLRNADLRNADLRNADLGGADLGGANLGGAIGSELAVAQTRILPDGALIGWKKLRDGVIAKLRIPEEAKRSHAFGRKCRAEFADVLEVIGADIGVSTHDGKTKYEAGKRVLPDHFDGDWMVECAGGIHFFITRAEAEAYGA